MARRVQELSLFWVLLGAELGFTVGLLWGCSRLYSFHRFSFALLPYVLQGTARIVNAFQSVEQKQV